MRTVIAALGFGCAMLLGTACSAATIEPLHGDLSINQGQGFQPVSGPMEANVGDTVMVSPGGSATVSYPDACKVNIQPGTVMTIGPLSPCASGSYADNYRDCEDPRVRDNDPYCTNNWWATGLFGAAFLGAIGAGIYGIVESKSTTPASP